jgi:aconitate decarboxylase
MTVKRYTGPREAPTEPDGATGALAQWLADFSLDDVPQYVIERAKDVVLDGLGCALVGAKLPWSKIAVDATFSFEGSGASPVIGWDRGIGLPAATLLNATFIQGFELDDFHPYGPLHSASIVLPALISTATALGGVDGRAAMRAIIAGFEVGPRVGMALHGAQMLSRGWHSGAVFGTHAAAATTGSLIGLDAARHEDALGLAGTQSGGLMAAQYEAMCKRMHHGFAARAGTTSALLAAGGYTGIKRVFERDYGGFLSMFGEGHDPDASQIAGDLGSRWETLRIALKPYAAMGALHGPLDGIFEIMAGEALIPDAIERIDISMSHAAYHHGWWEAERPLTPIGAQMHVGYAVAAAVIDGAAMIEQFTPTRIEADDVWALIPRVRAHHEPAFDGERASKVVVTMRDGTSRTAEIAIPRTMAGSLDRADVIAKFRVLTNGIVTPDRANNIIEQTLALETLSDFTSLIELLRGEVGSAFD